MSFSKYYDEIYAISKDIYMNAELGYKEFRTSKIIKDYLLKYDSSLEIEEFSRTGLKFTFPTKEKKDFKMCVLAEIDAVFAPSHFHANKETGAAHNCGHYTQIGIALAIFRHFVETREYENFDFAVSFVFIPAEEYVDLAFREELRKSGEISYYGGKPEAMKHGVFDDIDFVIATHAMGGIYPERSTEINSNLAGFLYKKYTYIGKAAHAGFDPFSGINAYSASTLFNVALGLARQQMREKEMVRINPIVMETNMSTNVIPNRIKIGTDLRTQSVEYMQEMVKRLDNIAKGSAMCLNAELQIETEMGYMPFVQDRYLSTFVREVFENFDAIPYMRDETPMSAAGDIGDLAYMIPCIQIGYSGFKGTIHGDDFIEDDPEYILSIFPEFVSKVISNMNGRIDRTKLYKRSFDEYEKVLNSILE